MSDFRFISCDWGTSNFRIRMVEVPSFIILAEVKNNRGVADFSTSEPKAFENHLLEALNQLDKQLEISISTEPLMISGMASASIGWRELPYAELPVSLDASDLICVTLPEISHRESKLTPRLISGLRSESDVMRGEEVELMGLLSRQEAANYLNACRVILPGTHSKHIVVRDNQILNFNTHMTGELFGLLSQHSVLKHSFHPVDFDRSFSPDAFAEGVESVMRNGLSENLFKVRSLSLLKGATAHWCYHFLSGLCIGHELLSLVQVDTPILCSASKAISKPYQVAAEQLGLKKFIMMPEERHELLAAEGQALFLQ